ncbi:MAG: hypothetical protein KGN34_08170, partial [Sphingomonadales bacterium]|nr:hypothetical protein [Sphingomonadales bacterium]
MPVAGLNDSTAIDPFAPLLAPGDSRQRRQHARRAEALAATRRLLAEAPGQFTLGRVADACGVSAQTLRNGFGRREDLMVAAFNDHTSAIWRTLDRMS